MKFTLEIELGSEAMGEYAGIGAALRYATRQIDDLASICAVVRINGDYAIRDANGDTVGKWEVVADDAVAAAPVFARRLEEAL